jgi:hypothetical protein
MPRRFVTPGDRLTFGAIGAWSVFLGVLQFLDRTAGNEVWLVPLWAVMFAVGGLLTFLYAWQLTSFRLRAWSNALIVTAAAGRGGGFVLALVNDTAPSIWRALLGIAVWTMLAFALYLVWRSRMPRPGGADGWPDA